MNYTKGMSVTLKIDNYPQLNIKEMSGLAADVNPGATSITLQNNDRITDDDFLLVGRRGAESSELRVVQSASGATIVVVDALTLHHDMFEDVSALFGNKIKIYRAPNVNGTVPADSSFSSYGSPVDIDTDQMSTTYTDDAGSADYWYKYTYYNSTSTEETDLNQTLAVRGGGVGEYETIDIIRSAAGFENNRNVTDHYIDGFRRSAQDQINGKLTGVYIVPFISPINSFISQITKSLAAGHIKLDQFGQNNEEGKAMIDWAEEQLEKIRSSAIVLTDEAGNILPKPNGSSTGVDGARMGFSGSPNDSEDGGGFKFTSDMRY